MHLYVLGAGFSYSFVDSAPLTSRFLKDREEIIEKPYFGPVREFMQECRFNSADANIETLMTLADQHASDQTNERLKQLVVQVLKDAFPQDTLDPKPKRKEEWFKFKLPACKEVILRRFARHLLAPSTGANVLTFNYDALLENAIELEQEELEESGSNAERRRFHSGRCYGFHAHRWVRKGGAVLMREKKRANHIFVLKLHGSILWRVPKPSASSIPANATLVLAAHERSIVKFPAARDTVERDMDAIPLIVPPILDKSKVLGHPALAEIWRKARCLIEQATQLTFIGYSFPPTDYGTEYLFRRNFAEGCAVEVINLRKNHAQKQEVKDRYDSVFGEGNVAYDWGDAATALEKMI